MSDETQVKPKRIAIGRGREIVGGPLAMGTRLVVGCPADELWCLDRSSLRLLWKVDSNSEIVRTAVGEGAFASDRHGQITIRSVDDGQTLWTLQGEARVHTLDDGRVLCSRADALEFRGARTGEWLGSVAAPGFAVDRLAGSVWVCQTRDAITALDIDTGAEVWRRDHWLIERMWGDEVLRDQRCFPTTQHGDVFATVAVGVVRISGKTGEVLWTAPENDVGVPGQGWFGQTPPVVAGPWVAVAGDVGELVIMEASTGRVVANWGRRFEKQLRGRPAISYKNRIAKCFEYGGGLAIYSVPDGELVRIIEHKWPLWELNEVDGRLFVSSGNGILLVYDESVWGL